MLSIFFLACWAIFHHSLAHFDPTTHENWHLLQNRNCDGNKTSRIVEGKPSVGGEFPWMARAEFRFSFHEDDSAAELRCGGTILNNRTVLTTARCMVQLVLDGRDPKGLKIVVGDRDKTTDPDCESAINVCAPPAQVIYPKEIIYHSEYHSVKHFNDIALIRLEKDIEFNSYVWPICMLQGSLLNTSFVGEEAIVAGWGVTDANAKLTSSGSNTLRKVTLQVRHPNICQTLDPANFGPEYQLCVGGEKNGPGPCLGDWGGPLMIKRDYKTYLIGIFSYNGINGYKSCGDKEDPPVFVKISAYLEWILDNLVENKKYSKIVPFKSK